jgi:hypothetical protein
MGLVLEAGSTAGDTSLRCDWGRDARPTVARALDKRKDER